MQSQRHNLAPRRAGVPGGRHRGITIVLVMLYMVLFSVLALGFYASVQTATQVSANEQRMTRSLLAAESGMAFTKYHLENLNVPAATAPSNLFLTVYSLLRVRLEGHPVLSVNGTTHTSTGTVGINAGTNDTITIPRFGAIRSDAEGGTFRIIITKKQNGQKLGVSVIGNFNGAASARKVELDYAVAQNAADIFNFGVASRSRISLNSNARIVGASEARLGSVLSTSTQTPTLVLDSNAQISGDVSFTNTAGNALSASGNATIAGLRPNQAGFWSHVHAGVGTPEFPVVDTDAFKVYAGNASYGGTTINPPPAGGERKFDSGTIRNPLIKANPDPNSWITFDSSVKVEGVIYIETPNRVRFLSNTEVRGAIVVQNNPTGDYNRNSLVFDSNAKILPIESLPDNNANYPEAMQQLTGAAILAPKFDLVLNSNFGSTGGSIIADRIKFDSNAIGLIKGSVINLADTMVSMNGNANVTIQSLGTSNYPAGVRFGSHYTPLADTYVEGVP